MRPILFVCLCVFNLVASASADAGTPITKLKLGVIAPLTGDVAPWGVDVKQALLFAQKEFPEMPVDLIFEDDRCRGRDAVAAAHKLLDIDHVDFAIVVCSESMLSTARIFEKAGVIVITPAATAEAIADAGDYIFRTIPNDGQAVRILYQYMAAHSRSVGVLTEERGFSEEVKKTLEDSTHAGTLGITNEDFLSDENDLSTYLLRLKAKRVDSVFLNVNSEARFLTALKLVRELMGNIPVYGLYFPGSKAFLDAAGRSANNIVYVETPSPDTAFTDRGKDIFHRFEIEYGAPQSMPFVFGSTFEAYHLLIEGSRAQNKIVSRPDLRVFLYRGKFSGVFGTYRFDSNGDIQGVEHMMKRIVNGEASPL